MRALIVTNMWPSPAAPALGSFVRDQVDALRALDAAEIEVFAFPPRGYARAARDLWQRHRRGERFDVVHAHFGLSAWPALAMRDAGHVVTLHGTDLRHPRSKRITQASLPFLDLVATVSAELAREVPGAARRRLAVLPCGVDLDRFVPIARDEARRQLGLPADEPCLLFAADPARGVKRFDRAREAAAGTRLLTLGDVEPSKVPLYVNAANAVLVPSDHEGFGLAVLEALACDVPVLATPTGVHRAALDEVPGTLCAPYEPDAWRTALRPHLDGPDPRVPGRARAELWSARRMARRVLDAWDEVLRLPVEAPRSGAFSA